MMKSINITSITKTTSTNLDGDRLFAYLVDNAVDDVLVITIASHHVVSSSFLNSSIGKYINIFGLNKFKTNVKISCNKNIYIQLKKYVDFYSDRVC